MKRLRLHMGSANSQEELDALARLVNEDVDEGARDKPGLVVHDFKVAALGEVSGAIDGTEGSVRTNTTVIVGVVYSIEEKKGE